MTTATLTARQQFLNDVLITAVEGGINYWAEVSDYDHGDDVRVASVRILDLEDGREYRLTAKMLANPIMQIINGPVQVRDDIRIAIFDGERLLDAAEIDAECADVIVQVALFGRIVYG